MTQNKQRASRFYDLFLLLQPRFVLALNYNTNRENM